MLILKSSKILSSEITPQAVFEQRRTLIKAGVAGSLAALLPSTGFAKDLRFSNVPKGPYTAALEPTAFEDATTYTNYYEFSTNKTDSTALAQSLKTDPWSIKVEGEVAKPGTYQLEDILKRHPLEERVYRFRCVEAWSMVIPWIGFPLANMLKQFEPTSKAKFVEFTTLFNPDVMVGQRASVLTWPYTEGLRIDEAMHPLAFMATGMYGDALPKQNGAPLRLVVPWKYGFKNIKAIVKIRFLENMPKTAWNLSAPSEYGFYANVNPEVPHPRWSQSRERILGASLFTPKRATEKFNGYGDQVAQLYADMDLKQFF